MRSSQSLARLIPSSLRPTKRKHAEQQMQGAGMFLKSSKNSLAPNPVVVIRYLLAVHNTKTGTISILPSSKTPHMLSHTVKALKSIAPSAAPSKTEYLQAKTTLGETFGTKKQKATIRANERNRIDVSAMEGVMGYVMDSIEKGAEGLMTTGSLLYSSKTNDTNYLNCRGIQRIRGQEQAHPSILDDSHRSLRYLSSSRHYSRGRMEGSFDRFFRSRRGLSREARNASLQEVAMG